MSTLRTALFASFCWLLCFTLHAADIDITSNVNNLNQATDGFTHQIGSTYELNQPTTIRYTIVSGSDGNLGSTDRLQIFRVLPSNFVGVTDVSVTDLAGTSLAVGETVDLDVTFTPTLPNFSLRVTILSNDTTPSGIDGFSWTISGRVNPNPKIKVTRSTLVIPDGSPDALGAVAQGFTQRLTYTIANTGVNALSVSGLIPAVGVASTGTNASYTIISGPTSSISGGGSASLVVDLVPTTVGSAFSVPISFDTNDPTVAVYNFSITGTTITATPEIEVMRISTLTTGVEHVVIGAAKNEHKFLTFTIANIGTTVLTVGSASIVGVPVNCTATVVQQPAASISEPVNSAAPANSSPLVVDLLPTVAGPFSFTISFSNNDANENPFVIKVVGTALKEARPSDKQASCGLGAGFSILLLGSFGLLFVGRRRR